MSKTSSLRGKTVRKNTFDVSENVSDIMEENIRESECEDLEKNTKISIIKSSQLISQRINDHGSYLQFMRNGIPWSPESDNIFNQC